MIYRTLLQQHPEKMREIACALYYLGVVIYFRDMAQEAKAREGLRKALVGVA